jgi:pimeloyl-ACP methyl ester carboxylesterase
MIHRTVNANGMRLHCVEQGSGPLVLLVHGFPESWYSWRHQLPVLAEAGYRAVALDVRGYGRSSKPAAVEAYRMVELVADIVGLVGALDEQSATLIGHDWGAPIVWNSALLRPDLFRGVAGLSVPYAPRGGRPPTEVFRQMAGDEEFYIEYFQEPGRAEAEIELDVRKWLLGFYYGASGDPPPGTAGFAMVAPGKLLSDRFVYPDELPAWLDEADLDFYAAEFERTGFSGGLNRYRNVDRDWSDLAAFTGRPIEIPALFVGGERDGPTMWGGASIERFSETLPRLTKSVILEGCGHWIQQERAQETNELLLQFLGETSA